MGWGQTSPAAETRKATVDAPKSVRIGSVIKLKGEFPDSPYADVNVLHRAAGKRSFKQVTTTSTGETGRWTAKVKPRSTGDWKAKLAAPASPDVLAAGAAPDNESDAERVRVRSKTKVKATKRDIVAGRSVEIRGRVRPAGQRRVIVKVGGGSKRTRTDRKGRFAINWKAPSAGHYRVKAVAKRNKQASGSKDSGGKVTAYRYANASWYGPGFYGNRTACGQTLTTSTRGVAHKTLPCGTKLTIRKGSREVQVRVIDRGPYHGNREFDLTRATKDDIGFGSTGQILVSR